jgi:hypothetical protein
MSSNINLLLLEEECVQVLSIGAVAEFKPSLHHINKVLVEIGLALFGSCTAKKVAFGCRETKERGVRRGIES